MNPDQIRDAISDTFRGRDGARLGYLTLWWLHALTNVFSERLRPLLPWEVWFIGTDRNPIRMRLRKRPLGYWVAKIVTLAVLLFGFAAIGDISRRIILAVL